MSCRLSSQLHLAGEGIGVARLLGFELIIIEIGGRAAGQQHIAEDAVFPEHILAFEIGAVGIFEDDGDELVFPLLQEGAHIKFCRIVRALTVTDIAAVDIYIKRGDSAEEGQNVVIVQRFQCKFFSIDAYRDVRWNFRRLTGKLVALIDIEGRLIAGALPVGRHLDAVKELCIRVKCLRQLRHLIIIMKIPFPREDHNAVALIALLQKRGGGERFTAGIGDKIGPPFTLVFLEEGKFFVVFPVDCVFHIAFCPRFIMLEIILAYLAGLFNPNFRIDRIFAE